MNILSAAEDRKLITGQQFTLFVCTRAVSLMEMVMEAHGMQAGIEAITRVNTSRGGSVLI